MLKEVIFRDDQKIATSDLNNLSLFSRQTFDALVSNAVSNLRYFTGFGATKTGITEVTVAPGWYWGGGPVYVREEATVFNMLTGGNYMPTTTKRIVAIVAYGEAIETDVQERSFVIDDQGNTEPNSVSMERLRYARLALVSGTESPDPQRPTLDASVIPVAWVRLTTSGVETIDMAEEYRLTSIEKLKQLVAAIDEWRAQIGQILDTILSELARTQAAIPPDYEDVLTNLRSRIEDLENAAKQPASVVQTFVDRFTSMRDSDGDYTGYNAKVGNGLTFGGGTATFQTVELNNPLDPRVKVANNILTPQQTGNKPRLSISNPDGSLAISQYTVQTTERVQKTLSRKIAAYTLVMDPPGTCWESNYRLGELKKYFNLDEDVASAWITNLIDQIKSKDTTKGTIYQFDWKAPDGTPVTVTRSVGAHIASVRFAKAITYDETYWEFVTKDATVSGSQVAQTFLNATNGWMTEVGLLFDQVSVTGDVHVFVTEVEGGKPVAGSVISRGTIAVANLKSGQEVKCQIEPVYLSGGKSYAIMVATSGNHFLKVRSGNKYISGTAYYLDDNGEWQAVQNSGDICMNLYFPGFDDTRIEVQMKPLTRAGGISSIRINAAYHVPDGTRLVWEIQRAGKWYQLSEGEYGALIGSPTLVNLRAVFIGTRDLMPAIDMSQTEIELLGQETTLTHISELHELDATTNSVKVHYWVRGWHDGKHDLDCFLITPGSPDTVVSPSTQTFTPDPEDGTSVKMEAVFTLSAKDKYRVKTTGSLGGSDGVFVITERRDFAF
jgi:hypothetical protein